MYQWQFLVGKVITLRAKPKKKPDSFETPTGFTLYLFFFFFFLPHCLFFFLPLFYYSFFTTFLLLRQRMPLGRTKHVADRLDYYYKVINTTILSKQNAASGLIPASVAITVRLAFPFNTRRSLIFETSTEPWGLY